MSPLPSVDAAVGAPVELGLFFVIGLFGTSHCLTMCGPLVSVYSERLAEKNARRDRTDRASTEQLLVQHALFNLGRLTIYATLGGLFGLLGSTVFRTADVVVVFGSELRGIVGIATGLLVVLTGAAHAAGRHSGALSGEVPMLAGITRRIREGVHSELDRWLGGYRTFVLGFVHGFLPCPLLYPAFLYAFTTGDPVGGALALAVLGAGTFPAMFLYGTLYQTAAPRRHAFVYRLVGVAFVLLGVNTLLLGTSLLGFDVPYLFRAPVYQPLGSPGVQHVPVLVALPVASVGSLLLVGVGAVALYRRRSVSYLLVTLALVAFTAQTLASTLTYLDVLAGDTYQLLDYLSNAVTVLLILGAIYYVSVEENDAADEPIEEIDER
ncbi:sulfite exporter TauE/SafE family protein [Halorussus litoreus]|uniref:sulfite exporter TauE/SafE family protein n=1 Tax=Halorussus litoreus TaxID=1710536 RepID=UPI00130063A6|nr:sulfite exporter TauE/SafE family protein [Halorussus litoreus]